MKVRIDLPTNKVNFTEVMVGSLTIWFSYQTPIAFHDDDGFAIRENDWDPTTGKHLNDVHPDKGRRIPGTEFESRLDSVLGRVH